MNLQHRNSVDILHAGIDLDKVVPTRQNLAKSSEVDRDLWVKNPFLVSRSKSWCSPVEVHTGFAFVSVTTQEFLVRRFAFQVAKARNVNSDRFDRSAA